MSVRFIFSPSMSFVVYHSADWSQTTNTLRFFHAMPSSRKKLAFASTICSVMADVEGEEGGEERGAGSDPSPARHGGRPLSSERAGVGKSFFSRSAAAARPRTP
jgi:hypothetical protein